MTFGRVWQLRADVGGGGRDGVVFQITPEAQDGPATAPARPHVVPSGLISEPFNAVLCFIHLCLIFTCDYFFPHSIGHLTELQNL